MNRHFRRAEIAADALGHAWVKDRITEPYTDLPTYWSSRVVREVVDAELEEYGEKEVLYWKDKVGEFENRDEMIEQVTMWTWLYAERAISLPVRPQNMWIVSHAGFGVLRREERFAEALYWLRRATGRANWIADRAASGPGVRVYGEFSIRQAKTVPGWDTYPLYGDLRKPWRINLSTLGDREGFILDDVKKLLRTSMNEACPQRQGE